MLFLALYRVFKSMEPQSFDNLAETDVVRKYRDPYIDHIKIGIGCMDGISV